MEITEIRIKLMDESEDRLRAFCSITFSNCFVVRDLKIIEGNNGPFVAMPSRKLTSHCRECRYKNHLRAKFCNQCGSRLATGQVDFDSHGRAKLYADVAHPINAESREMIQARVLSGFVAELERAKEPDYASRYDDTYESESAPVSTKPQPSRTVQTGDGMRRTDPAESGVPAPHKQDRELSTAQKPEHPSIETGSAGEPPGSPPSGGDSTASDSTGGDSTGSDSTGGDSASGDSSGKKFGDGIFE